MGKTLKRVPPTSKRELRYSAGVPVSKREVADPLAQMAAARMMGQGLAGLGFTGKGRGGVPASMVNGYLGMPFDMLVRRFQRDGLAKKQAIAAALRIIYAQNLAGKKL